LKIEEKIEESEEKSRSDCWKLRRGVEQRRGEGQSQEEVREEGEEQKVRRTEDAEGQRIEVKSEKGRRNIRKMQLEGLREAQGKSVGQFVVSKEFEIEKADGWHECKGFVPVQGEEAIRVRIRPSRRCWMENTFVTDRQTHFTRKDRKKIFTDMEKAEVRISEVFSPPRIAEMAGKKGLTQGTSFDLETGWDLERPEDRRRMWRTLKEEDPELLVICPPCTAFTMLQELNFDRMDPGKAVRIVKTGLEHLGLAVALARWQIQRGKYVLLEQPSTARSWDEECVQELLELEGVRRCLLDMCCFGMNVDGEGLNRKTTAVMTNSEAIADRISKRCTGGHRHVPLMGGRAKQAQVYPKKFCEAVVQGIREQVQRDGMWNGLEEKWVLAGEEDPEEEEEEARGEPEVEGMVRGEEAESGIEISSQDKAAVMKLHKGLGHPAKPDLVRFMKSARVRAEVIRWTDKRFKCEAWEQAQTKDGSTRNHPKDVPTKQSNRGGPDIHRVLSLEESRRTLEELKRQGRSNRVLPTKIARRYKPSEQPGEPSVKKSRLCLRGDLDPDILTLEKFSPTVNTMNLAVMMQIAANQNMTGQIADFKNAFCQSEPLRRKEGDLFFKQPPEGIRAVQSKLCR